MLTSVQKKKAALLDSKILEEVKDYTIMLFDADGTILSWSKSAEEIKGYKAEEIVGLNFSIFYLPEDRQIGLPERLLEKAKKENCARYFGRRMRKDGTVFIANMVLTALHDEDNEVIGFSKLTQKITTEFYSQ
jgi:PAS domain S-box-containing protein